VFIVYSQGGKMVADYYIAGFDSRINGIGSQETHCPSAECTPGKVFPLGAHTAIKDVIDSDPTALDRLRPTDRVREIIKRVAKKIPNVVGGPTSVVEFTPTGGPKWIDKGKCADSN
jgi:hypothetical protein